MPVKINQEKCSKCYKCRQICPEDVFDSEPQQVPFLKYPEECFHCGACILDCPESCIEFDLPLPLRPRFIHASFFE